MTTKPSVLSLIGSTPTVEMSRLARVLEIPGNFSLFGKCEFLNPGGSVKDRIALTMVETAERDGLLFPGCTLIEPTSGNTGIGLSLVAAVKGYPSLMVLPEKMSQEKVNIMKRLGAKIHRTPTEAKWDSPDSHIGVSKKLNLEFPKSIILDQYANRSNPDAHYFGTGAELIQDLDGRIDVVFIGAGTGGTLSGIARIVKEKIPTAWVVGVDPVGSILAEKEKIYGDELIPKNSNYFVEGIGYDFIPRVLDRSLVNEWIKVEDAESFYWAREIIRTEGLLVGGSSGSVIAGLKKWMKLDKKFPCFSENVRIAVILPDSCRNYMSKFIDDDWMIDHGFLQPEISTEWAIMKIKKIPRDFFRPALTVDIGTRIVDAVEKMKENSVCLVLDRDKQLLGSLSYDMIIQSAFKGPIGDSLVSKDVINVKFLKHDDSIALLAHALTMREQVFFRAEDSLISSISRSSFTQWLLNIECDNRYVAA